MMRLFIFLFWLTHLFNITQSTLQHLRHKASLTQSQFNTYTVQYSTVHIHHSSTRILEIDILLSFTHLNVAPSLCNTNVTFLYNKKMENDKTYLCPFHSSTAFELFCTLNCFWLGALCLHVIFACKKYFNHLFVQITILLVLLSWCQVMRMRCLFDYLYDCSLVCTQVFDLLFISQH